MKPITIAKLTKRQTTTHSQKHTYGQHDQFRITYEKPEYPEEKAHTYKENMQTLFLFCPTTRHSLCVYGAY